MKAIVIAIVAMMTAQAHADGFTCLAESGELKIKVYNYVNAQDGTRVPARMVLSNPNLNAGERTLAVFNSDSGTLEVSQETSPLDTTYVGKVDLRFAELSAKEATVLGTRLADLATVSLAVDFKYGDNLAKGDQVEALITLAKRNGGVIREQAVCERYLKSE